MGTNNNNNEETTSIALEGEVLVTLCFEYACFYNSSHYSDHILFLINLVILSKPQIFIKV